MEGTQLLTPPVVEEVGQLLTPPVVEEVGICSSFCLHAYMYVCLEKVRYQYNSHAMLVMLWDVIEGHQSYLMHHSKLNKTPLVKSNSPPL